MTFILLILGVASVGIGIAAVCLLLRIAGKISAFTQVDVEAAVRAEMSTGRQEAANSAKALREEVGVLQQKGFQALSRNFKDLSDVQKERLDKVTDAMGVLTDTSRKDATALRDEIAKTQKMSNDSLVETIGKMAESQKTALIEMVKSVNQIVETNRTEITNLREELKKSQKESNEAFLNHLKTLGDTQKSRLDEVTKGMNQVVERNRNEIVTLKEEVKKTQKDVNDSVVKLINNLGLTQKERLDEVTKAMKELITASRQESGILREKLEAQFKEIQKSNEQKLDEMRKTVDEKLHATLEQRLGEKFKLVSERLEAVHQGLGDMQKLATGVGDLKRVLTNVKTRGTWGEIQLGAILEQILTPDQYAPNVQTKENTRERVEFAVRLPGRNGDGDHPVWLPIDAKFPKEDYERLVDASATGDAESTKAAIEGLLSEIDKCAKEISNKHINPPNTTDFAIMFLPTEGLYAEVLRQPGMHDLLQQKYRIVVAGPTTLAAVLNSLRMGFHTLAIEQRSSEVWTILGAVKTEFGKFGEIIDKVKGQLATAANTLDKTAVRTRAMNRKLGTVTALPRTEAEKLLQIGETSPDEDKAEEENIDAQG